MKSQLNAPQPKKALVRQHLWVAPQSLAIEERSVVTLKILYCPVLAIVFQQRMLPRDTAVLELDIAGRQPPDQVLALVVEGELSQLWEARDHPHRQANG